eukprot:CAMPEP_0172931640 /NCGR_PEP_ID=MMETSP1075-20121228/219599_1 /TAXON_ID=2916 /ORGANISM="Ceratium fusus, Strain PA161109" /LENGTH=402 /DNA_ID=CAMNT_0013792963 /DNA_START=33 /DNA_END=1242 /DNA_ORIENTATION=+
MTGGTGAFTACNDFVNFVQALAEKVQALEAKNNSLEARITELEAVPRSGSLSPASDLLGMGTWERPDKQQPQQQQQQQATDLLGIETPPPSEAQSTTASLSEDLQKTPSPVKQQQQQQQATDLLGIETPPPSEAQSTTASLSEDLQKTPSPVKQQQPPQPQNPQTGSPGSASGIEKDNSPCGGSLNQEQCDQKLEDPLILADPWASKSPPTTALLQAKPPPPAPNLPVKPPPMVASGTGPTIGTSGLLVKHPPLAIQKALQAASEVVLGASVDEAAKAPPPVKVPPEALRSTSVDAGQPSVGSGSVGSVPPVRRCPVTDIRLGTPGVQEIQGALEPTFDVAVKQLPCKAPPKQLLLKAEQPPFKPPPLAEVVSEVATGVAEVPSKALPTKLVIKAPPPQFAR